MKYILDKTIKKDKKLVKVAQKKSKTNKDVWFLLFHDPILRIAICIPIIIILIEFGFQTLTPISLLIWLLIYPVALFFLLRYMPIKDEETYKYYEKIMPKKSEYKSKTDYYKAYLKFIWLGSQGKYKK